MSFFTARFSVFKYMLMLVSHPSFFRDGTHSITVVAVLLVKCEHCALAQLLVNIPSSLEDLHLRPSSDAILSRGQFNALNLLPDYFLTKAVIFSTNRYLHLRISKLPGKPASFWFAISLQSLALTPRVRNALIWRLLLRLKQSTKIKIYCNNYCFPQLRTLYLIG